jgi:hypothetical protein
MTGVSFRIEVQDVSSSGIIQVDVNEEGSSVFSTPITIDAGEETSDTAATPGVVSDSSLASRAKISVDIDASGTNAKGVILWITGVRTSTQ